MDALYVRSLAFFLFCVVSASRGSAPIPFLLWTNDGNIPKSSEFGASLGQSISMSDMQKSYLAKFLDGSSRSTVVFLQDKLSLDDLTKYSNKPIEGKPSIFENLKKFLGTRSAVTLPGVEKEETESSFVALLKKKHDGHFEEIFSSDIDTWKYTKEKVSNLKKNLFVFHLPPVKGSTEAGKITVLSQNDDLIGKFLSQFESNGLYTAILTASEPSDIVDKMQKDEILGETEMKRHLLSIDTTIPGLYNFSDCVYLYATNIKFSYANQTVSFVNSSYTPSGKCANNRSSVAILFNKKLPDKVTKFDLRMVFVKSLNTDWVCSSLIVTYSGSLNNTKTTDLNIDFSNSTSVLNAPNAMSYSCGIVQLHGGVNNSDTLTFDNFQLQPFGIENKRFSNPYDCVPFFTIPILTGLFVGAVLIIGLFTGLMAMMSISTMDRFDDPKGPTIQVPHE